MEVYRTIQSLLTVISCKKDPPIFLHHTYDISNMLIMIKTPGSWCTLPRNFFRRRNENPFESTVTTTWGWNRKAASIVSFSLNWHFPSYSINIKGRMHKGFPSQYKIQVKRANLHGFRLRSYYIAHYSLWIY